MTIKTKKDKQYKNLRVPKKFFNKIGLSGITLFNLAIIKY